jgi:hypothetical protein
MACQSRSASWIFSQPLRACEKIDFSPEDLQKSQLAKELEKKAPQVRAEIDGDRDTSCWETTGAFGISRSVWEPVGLQRR